MVLKNMLQALGRHPTLAKLELRGYPLCRDEAREIRALRVFALSYRPNERDKSHQDLDLGRQQSFNNKVLL